PRLGIILPPLGAQRLSASQRSARSRRAITTSPPARCSTPFGITEVGTRAWPGRRRRYRMELNAFRHHRGRHGDLTTTRGATILRAQRLSASQRSALNGDKTPFRTLKCSTPFGITEVGTAR